VARYTGDKRPGFALNLTYGLPLPSPLALHSAPNRLPPSYIDEKDMTVDLLAPKFPLPQEVVNNLAKQVPHLSLISLTCLITSPS
jgi:hypothetical protein